MPPPNSSKLRRSLQTSSKPPKTQHAIHPQFTKLQVVNTFSSDTTTPSIMLCTQNHTYVFNCGEGMQRICQAKARVPRISDVFLTRVAWDVVGGLPEMMDPKTTIHGPRNLAHFLATFRNYLFRTSLELDTNEFGEKPESFVDERVTITPIPLFTTSGTSIPESSTFSFAKNFSFPAPAIEGTDKEIVTYKKDIVQEMFRRGVYDNDMDDETLLQQWDGARKRRAALITVNLPRTQPTDITMAYFVKNKDMPGKFDVEAAMALGVPVGKLFTKLKNGEDVQVPVLDNEGKPVIDGQGKEVRKTVRSQEVVGKAVPGAAVLIIDLPALKYVDKVLKNETLNSEMIKKAEVVVHMLADEVASDTRYIKWMESFTESTKHLVMAPKLTPDNLVLPGGYMLDLDRNTLDDSIFPLSHHAGKLTLTPNSYSKKYVPAPPLPSPYTDPRIITDIRNGSVVDFRGKIQYQATPDGHEVVEFKHYLGSSTQNKLDNQNRLSLETVVHGMRELVEQVGGTRINIPQPGDNIEIITLGTGSAVPNKYRNVSATVLRIPGVGNILLDCGEGTLASLKRHFSVSQFQEFIKDLRTIYISHLHADHHLGIIAVMKEYSTIQNLLPTDQRRPIFIIAPWRLFNSLYDYNQVENIGLEDYTVPFVSSNLIPRHLLPLGSTQNLDVGLFQGFLSSMNLQSFETCYVQHCPQAYGVAITHKSGWKIVYSGDCRPSGDLVEIGRDATVCIHEATVAETQPQEALDKMHSTTGEAIMIGKRMGAKYILLTHFSQKWSKIPEFVLEWEKHKEQVEKYGNVGIAFDHMAVKVGEMWKLPLFYSAFEVMYGEERGKKAWLRQMALRGASKREGEEIEDPRQSKRKQIEKDSGNEVTLEMV